MMGNEKKYYLPLSHSWLILGSMLAISLGGFYFPAVEKLVMILGKIDPWVNVSNIYGIVLRICLFIITIIIASKQMSYYYLKGGGQEGGIFVQSIFSLNYAELSLDYLLAIFGAVLFPIAIWFPFLWFAGLAFYCFIGWIRMVLTLSRKRFAKMIEKGDIRKIRYWVPWDVHPFHNIERGIIANELPYAVITESLKRKENILLAASIENIHQNPGYDKINIKYAMGGWRIRFFRFVIINTLAFAATALITYILGARLIAMTFYLICALMFLMAFLLMVKGAQIKAIRKCESWVDGKN